MVRYAAAPGCLILGLLTACTDAGSPLCGHGSWLGGMATMYGVMALLHAGPWLRLLSKALIMKDS